MSKKTVEIKFTRKNGTTEELQGDFGLALVAKKEGKEVNINAEIDGSTSKHVASILVLRILPALGIDLNDLLRVASSGDLGDAKYVR